LHIVISNLRWAVCAEHAVNSAMELSEASRLRPMVQSSPLVDLAGRIRGDCDVVLNGVISRTQYNRPRVFQTRYLAKASFRDRSLLNEVNVPFHVADIAALSIFVPTDSLAGLRGLHD